MEESVHLNLHRDDMGHDQTSRTSNAKKKIKIHKNPSSDFMVFLRRTTQNPFSQRKSSDEEGLIPVSETTVIWKNLCSSWQKRLVILKYIPK